MTKKLTKKIPYPERLRAYEKDKAALLRRSGELTAAEFDAAMKEIIEKWHI